VLGLSRRGRSKIEDRGEGQKVRESGAVTGERGYLFQVVSGLIYGDGGGKGGV